MVFSALALFLMVADARFRITQPLRAADGTVLYPVQWLAMRPVLLARHGGGYFESCGQPVSEEAAPAPSWPCSRSGPTRWSNWLWKTPPAQVAGSA
jgi:hypothetical protein